VGKPQALLPAPARRDTWPGTAKSGRRSRRKPFLGSAFPAKEIERVKFPCGRAHAGGAASRKWVWESRCVLLCHEESEGDSRISLGDLSSGFRSFPSSLRLVDLRRGGLNGHKSSAWLPVLSQAVRLWVHLRRVQGLKRARELLSGEDLLAMGEPPGPRLGQVLAEIHERILAGDITTREEALSAKRRNFSAACSKRIFLLTSSRSIGLEWH
jgi:hypothetical protein